MLKKKKYVVLNVWPNTHHKVMSLAKTKEGKLDHGEHTKESADVVINRLLNYYNENHGRVTQ